MSRMSPELRAQLEWKKSSEWLDNKLDHYKEEFALSDSDLRNRKILEIGANDRRIAAACLLKGITKEVYSLEPAYAVQKRGFANERSLRGVVERLPSELRDEITKRTVAAVAEQTPFENQSFDLVIGRKVNFDSIEQLTARLKELLRVGREVRLFPVDASNRALYDEAIKAITDSVPLDVTFKTTLEADIRTTSGMRHIKQDVLILRPKYYENDSTKE